MMWNLILWQFCGNFMACPLSMAHLNPPRSQLPVPSWCLSSFVFLQLPDILSCHIQEPLNSLCWIYPKGSDDLHLPWVTMAWGRTSSPNRHALGCVKSACCQWQLAVSIVAEEMSKSTTMLLPSWHFFKKLHGCWSCWEVNMHSMHWGPGNFQGNMGRGSAHQAD